MRSLTVPAALLSLAVLACTETPTDPEQLSSPIVSGVTHLVGSNVAVMINGQSISNRLPIAGLTISARLLEDGSVSGRGAVRRTSPGFQGPIVALERLAVDLWCLKFAGTARPTPQTFVTAVIHDIGDGVNTFDEVVVIRDNRRFVPCGSSVGTPRPILGGDFKVVVFE